MMNKSIHGNPIGKKYFNACNLVTVLTVKLGKCKC